MGFAVQRLVSAFCTAHLRCQAPQALHKAPATLNACFRPLQIAFGRAVGQHEPAHGICAILVNNVIGIDDILFGLGHLLDAACNCWRTAVDNCPYVAFAAHLVGAQPCALCVLIGLVRDHALREQRRERLFHINQADMA